MMMMRTASRVLARLAALAVLVLPVMGREMESGSPSESRSSRTKTATSLPNGSSQHTLYPPAGWE